ncbi:hypothetical protein DYB32_000346 [Aphanomyces invadans]|uniref:Uncharacterized protein n=1 Tax=Aphanomyces invadans TaxID=157072 RepID=A0A3R7AGB7_9STRA|nr:hypothetical protein DYB32_000346 [Aphanomyces invadans]
MDKRKRILDHPMVLSVTSNGREVTCKCGRIVRLNPPWYILKYEQHTTSRNCVKPMGALGPTLATPSHSALEIQDILNIEETLAEGETIKSPMDMKLTCIRELKAHPNFSCISSGGQWVRGLCGCVVQLKKPWHVDSFKDHLQAGVCRGRKKRPRKVKTPSLTPSNTELASADLSPCPGLRGNDVIDYVTSAVQLTGGSRPKFKIARELFPHLFQSSAKCDMSTALCPFEKKLVHDTVQKEALWWIDKEAATVRSFQCAGVARMKHHVRQPCQYCTNLRAIPSFRTAISLRGVKSTRNPKFIPRTVQLSSASLKLPLADTTMADSYARELRQLLACYNKDEVNPHYYWLSVAEMGMAHAFQDSPVVIGLLQWIVTLKEKERRGVGKQNMPYAPALDDFISSLGEISAEASELFQQHFCRRSKRHSSKKVAQSHPNSLLALLVASTDPPEQTDLLLEVPPSQTLGVDSPSLDNADGAVPTSAADLITQRELEWKHYARQHPNEKIPCPGLLVASYVENSLQMTGGSRPRHVIARELFPAHFVEGKVTISHSLSVDQQQLLMDAVHREAIWRIDKAGECVRSMKCMGMCVRHAEACAACMALHRNASFRSAVSRARRQTRNLDNIRFIPNQFMTTDPVMHKISKNATLRWFALNANGNVMANSSACFWLKVARFGITGAFRNYPVLEGVYESLMHLKEKQRRGAGKQNMYYPPALDAFMKQLLAISPKALELFSDKIVCGHSVRAHVQAQKRKHVAASTATDDSLVFLPHDIPMPMPAILMYQDDDDEHRLLSVNNEGYHHHATTFGQDLLAGDSELGATVMNL